MFRIFLFISTYFYFFILENLTITIEPGAEQNY